MKVGRFIAAALAAGVVLNAGAIVLAHMVLAEHVERLIQRLGGLPWWAPLSHLSIRFTMAAVALWILLLARRASGGTLGAMAATAAAVWLLAYPVPLEMWHVHAGMGPAALAGVAAWGFMELMAGLAVGWLVYRGGAPEAPERGAAGAVAGR